MKVSIWAMIKGQFNKLPPLFKADLTGKTVLVLGANTGLGFEAAKHFASMNPGRLILACRSQSRGQAALEELQATTGYKKGEVWIVDLADFASVTKFADKFEQDGGRLDILVENAAKAQLIYEPTKDGWETSLQVNALSTPFVALRLLPRMMQTAREHATVARIVVVSSEVHYLTSIPKELLNRGDALATLGSTDYCTPKKMRASYPTTKLLNVYFVRALNEYLGPTAPIIVNAVNPGMCVSELRRDLPAFLAFISRIVERIMAFTAEEGSRQLVFGAVGEPENPDALRGEYINQSRVEEPSDFVVGSVGHKAQAQIWDEMVEILKKVDPRISATIDQYLSGA
ncbi:hypothetical protein C8F04DRAFT_1074729 [Mycena alexandri]|uniref:NAD(P)-binding protein n=1 Tax=Mycena alexandri TaxID=1745969 RepID=A0AAD6X890_9AGAR|nr:hypothetical protein C8F04DRAFT_1074729 [Mycena alexandri]